VSWLLALLLSASLGPADDQGGTLRGRVTDPQGAAIVGARVEASGPSGRKSALTGPAGEYVLAGLRPGTYAVIVTRDRFAPYLTEAVRVAPGHTTGLDVQLALAAVQETVTVRSPNPPLSLEPQSNAGAIVIRGADLDALPDDPDEMAEALQALAGAAAGPNGGQLFIDGFTGGRIPPKSAIREIRLNANPFSAEYDRPGFGRIEILTKPGSDRFRGDSNFRFNDDALNSRNPFAPNRAPYQRREWGGTLSGPLVANKASYFVDFERRSVDDNEIVNATVLSSDLEPRPFRQAVLAPQSRTSFSPRLDWQLGASHTVIARYTYSSVDRSQVGIGGFSLPSRAYGTSQTQHTLQLSETSVLGKVVNETHLRLSRERATKTGDDSVPTLQVLDAFTGGGAQIGPSSNRQDRLELQNVTSFMKGAHSVRAGFRLRAVREDDVARQGFGGTVVFSGGIGPQLDASGGIVRNAQGQPISGPLSSLERYRRTLLLERLGLSAAQIRALGGGASQLQIVGGDAAASVSQWDVAPFVQDDWRVRPDLILSLGLRYEKQNNIAGGLDLAPRVGVSWSVGNKDASGRARMVVRAGAGVFYDRFGEDLILRARRFDGLREQQYIVTDPAVLDRLIFGEDVAGVPSAGSLAAFAAAQTTWRVAPKLDAPYNVQSSLGIERRLPGNFTLSATLLATWGRRHLRSRNINAPTAEGVRPLGAAAGNVYQIEATGRMDQYQAILGVNNRLSRSLTVFARGFFARARSDTDGAGTFPANQYDLSGEYGRAAFDVPVRFVLGGNITGPWGVRISPFVIASSGRPFNITVGRDLNGDSLFTDRPSFATNAGAPGVVSTVYGLLDTRAVGVVIPRNFGEGPGFVVVNLRLSKTIPLGGRPRDPGPTGGEEGGGGRDGGGGRGGPGGGLGPRGGFGGGRGGGERGGDEGGGGRGLTVSISVQNVLNHVNPAAPVGNLSSPLFGQSLSSAGGFGFGPGGVTAGNRRIELIARFSF
jgi:hypothetical protein